MLEITPRRFFCSGGAKALNLPRIVCSLLVRARCESVSECCGQTVDGNCRTKKHAQLAIAACRSCVAAASRSLAIAASRSCVTAASRSEVIMPPCSILMAASRPCAHCYMRAQLIMNTSKNCHPQQIQKILSSASRSLRNLLLLETLEIKENYRKSYNIIGHPGKSRKIL